MIHGQTCLDVHRAIHAWPMHSIDYDAFFSRARADKDGLLLPEPTDLLVSLGTHAAQDGWSMPFRTVVDGLSTIKVHGLKPNAIVERAVSWSARRATAVFLAVLERFGLEGEDWSSARKLLDPQGTSVEIARSFVRFGRDLRASKPRTKFSMLRSLDGVLRPGAFVATRSMLYLGDVMWRSVPHFLRQDSAR